MISRIIATIGLVLCAGLAQALPVLTTSGATGVVVGDKTFDVEFVDGTCIVLFGDCDEASDFTFLTFDDARAASTALLGLIQRTAAPLLDLRPDLMSGCSSQIYCDVVTPYNRLDGDRVAVAVLRNEGLVIGDNDAVREDRAIPGIHTGSLGEVVYARWTAVSAVPLPASAPMLFAGIAGLAAIGRRRKRKTG